MRTGAHMPLMQLARSRRQTCFDGVSKALGATQVEVQVVLLREALSLPAP